MEYVRKLTIKMWGARHKVLRYLISGSTAAAVNFFFLYAFTEWAGIYYLYSVVLAFLIALVVSFILQKFWTFQDKSREGMHRQAVVYTSLAIVNTGINTLLVYLFVEYAGFHYLLGQFISSGCIALESFFMYQIFIFRKTAALSDDQTMAGTIDTP